VFSFSSSFSRLPPGSPSSQTCSSNGETSAPRCSSPGTVPRCFCAVGFPQNADLLFGRVAFAFHCLGSFQVALTNQPRLRFRRSRHSALRPLCAHNPTALALRRR
jgi:hypothetical protein